MAENSTRRGPHKAWALAKRLAFPVSLLLVIVFHITMILQVERLAPIFGEVPLTWVDFDTHVEQTWRVTDALAGWGKTWAYDVQLLAGYPNGTVFDADNKAWELWTYVLWQLGLPKGTAFNLFVLFAHLLLPGVVYLSARLFGLGRWEALLSTVLGLMIWFFDGHARWGWYSGGVSFALVSYLFLLPLALFYRQFSRDRPWLLVPLALVMGLGHLIHPSIFISLAPPMIALYASRFRGLSWKRHVGIVAMAGFVIAVNAYWLIVAFQFAHYVTDHEPFFVAGLSNLLTDYVGIIQNLTTTGLVGNRTAFRFLILLAAVFMLVLWKRERDDRFLPMAVGAGFLFFLAYVGGYFWVFRQVQPYRNVVPLTFLCTIPAAHFVGELVRRRSLSKLPRMAYAAIALLALPAVSHLIRDVIYFLPTLIPDVPALPTGEAVPISPYGYPPHPDYRHIPPLTDYTEVADWVRKHDDGQGRILVDWWVLGEHLAWRTNAQILGGFRERNLDHRAANLFVREPDGHVSDEDLAHYLESYTVRWVIMSEPRPYFEHKVNLLELVATFEPHRIYRTKVPISYFQHGSGQVRASLNRIEVNGTNPAEDIVLRFHWLETLVCRAECRVEREHRSDDPVGFIRVPAPHPANFTVENGY